MKLLIILLATTLLSGCLATMNNKLNDSIYDRTKKYKEPISGKTAQVRVFYSGNFIDIYPNSNSNIKKELKNDKDGGSVMSRQIFSGYPGFGKMEYEVKSLGMPFEPTTTKAFGEFKVTTEKPVVIKMSYYSKYNGTSTSCPSRFFRVQFEENRNYAIRMTTTSRCYYEILEYSNDGKLMPVRNIERI